MHSINGDGCSRSYGSCFDGGGGGGVDDGDGGARSARSCC